MSYKTETINGVDSPTVQPTCWGIHGNLNELSVADFRCKDRLRCIPKSQVCDGRSHCNDGSDEVDCQSGTPLPENSAKVLKCRFGSKLCQDGTACVPLSHLCDGERDCQDGSDERGCREYFLL